jgi:hypothetical protein
MHPVPSLWDCAEFESESEAKRPEGRDTKETAAGAVQSCDELGVCHSNTGNTDQSRPLTRCSQKTEIARELNSRIALAPLSPLPHVMSTPNAPAGASAHVPTLLLPSLPGESSATAPIPELSSGGPLISSSRPVTSPAAVPASEDSTTHHYKDTHIKSSSTSHSRPVSPPSAAAVVQSSAAPLPTPSTSMAPLPNSEPSCETCAVDLDEVIVTCKVCACRTHPSCQSSA